MADLFFDIETFAIPLTDEERAEKLAAVKPPGNYKKPESIAAWLEQNADQIVEQDYRKGALNALHGQIVSIAWAFDDGPIHCADAGSDGQVVSDKNVIGYFFDAIADQAYHHPDPEQNLRVVRWIGHNVIDFDLRFLKQRAIINQLTPPCSIPADNKHGSTQVFDTMREWAGFKNRVSLNALARAFGMGEKIMDGSAVHDLVIAGEWEELRAYNVADVELTRQVFRRLAYR